MSDKIVYTEEGVPQWPYAPLKNELLSNQCSMDADCEARVEVGYPAVCKAPWEKDDLDPLIVDNVIDSDALLYGVPGFDNVFQGFLTVNQIVTMESWVYMMYTYNATNENGLAIIFFLVVVIIGNFFILNLFIAQFVDKFTELKEETLEQENAKEGDQ